MFSLRNYILTLTIVTLLYCGNAQLTPSFYARSCPTINSIVRSGMTTAVARETRMAASILRLHFHDCFVNGCDASILLDDVGTFVGEQNAFPNRGSVRGYDVIDTIKTAVEAACPGIVSCADILALAARDATVLAGGPTWAVPLGRRDARTASQSDANTNLPPPTANLADLIRLFSDQGLNEGDMVALSGSHSIGFAQCSSFSTRIYNDTNINASFAASLRATCPSTGGSNLTPLDTTTTNVFDNAYYTNLLSQRGLLHSDQAIFSGGSSDALVRQYSTNGASFRSAFAAAMVKMGNNRPLTGANGEIRRSCGVVN